MSDLSEALRLFITNTARRSRLEVGGEIDLATVDALRDHLALLVESGTGDVDVDMAAVTFCDATTPSRPASPHTRRWTPADATSRSSTHRDQRPPAATHRPRHDPARPRHRGPQHRSHLPKGRVQPRAPHATAGGGRKEPSMPIDKHVTGLSADITLRRAATNGEHHVDVVGDFNDWSPHHHPMISGPAGWSCTLTVPDRPSLPVPIPPRRRTMGERLGSRRLRRQRPRRPRLRHRPHSPKSLTIRDRLLGPPPPPVPASVSCHPPGTLLAEEWGPVPRRVGDRDRRDRSAGFAERPNRYRRSPMARSIWSGTISFGHIEHLPHQAR